MSPSRLLRVKPEFCIAATAFVTTREQQPSKDDEECKKRRAGISRVMPIFQQTSPVWV
jgi:hypothetical protein